MKKSELKNIIREHIEKHIKESTDIIYYIKGIIITDNDRNLQSVLSDIRSLQGITTIDHRETTQASNSEYFRAEINIKLDPYPFKRDGITDMDEITSITVSDIKKIKGVLGFKQTSPTSKISL